MCICSVRLQRFQPVLCIHGPIFGAVAEDWPYQGEMNVLDWHDGT